MSAIGYSIFDTDLGRCAIAWGDHGVVRVALPDADDAALRRSLLARHPDAKEAPPPPAIAAAIAAITALVRGDESDLGGIVLDLRPIGEFARGVYEIAREIRPGATKTYGEIARRLGDVAKSREVGQALGRNPFPIVVPCHRVMGADGRLVGFSAPGGVDTKLKLLAIEQRLSGAAPSLFDGDPAYRLAAAPRQKRSTR
ncbi:MAG: methylated-DNA--[protein]-cysteine S-methyltransferase [Alphaproteobacteria bacterium]|nr:methylated-DNA--[protein]-cysteine S-methyltransferase [Alphaproteobacteria bacterium]